MTTIAAIRLERSIAATPAQLFHAWTDPKMLVRWMAPGRRIVSGSAVEPRVGGFLLVEQSLDDKPIGGFYAEFTEIVPDAKLVFNWGFMGPELRSGKVFDTRLSVTFADEGNGRTKLVLVQEKLEEFAAAMPDIASKIEMGWGMVLDLLAKAVEG
jgi:uncharacterized protein YndB with AHSA1/START domain